MRGRSIAAAAALVALALAMTGCGRSAPPITDAQVEEWRDLAAETIPLATETIIDVSRGATMAGQSTSIDITVNFANFADMKASDQALADFDALVGEQAGGVAVITKAVNAGSDAFEADVAARLLERLPHLRSAKASTNDEYYPGEATPTLSVTVYVFVTDAAAIDPQWLDDVATYTQQVASDAGGSIATISILPAEAVDADLTTLDFELASIRVSDLDAIKDFGVDNGCLRTDSWAYDVSESYVAPYPANAGEGACA